MKSLVTLCKFDKSLASHATQPGRTSLKIQENADFSSSPELTLRIYFGLAQHSHISQLVTIQHPVGFEAFKKEVQHVGTVAKSG
jgi:hypothetical protein